MLFLLQLVSLQVELYKTSTDAPADTPATAPADENEVMPRTVTALCVFADMLAVLYACLYHVVLLLGHRCNFLTMLIWFVVF
jgi:hypothetical protein